MNNGETCLQIGENLVSIEEIYTTLQSHCHSWTCQKNDYVFDFQSARARIRAEPKMVWIRVEADDIASCHGTKTLLLAVFRQYLTAMPERVLWVEAGSENFAAIRAYATNQQ